MQVYKMTLSTFLLALSCILLQTARVIAQESPKEESERLRGEQEDHDDHVGDRRIEVGKEFPLEDGADSGAECQTDGDDRQRPKNGRAGEQEAPSHIGEGGEQNRSHAVELLD